MRIKRSPWGGDGGYAVCTRCIPNDITPITLYTVKSKTYKFNRSYAIMANFGSGLASLTHNMISQLMYTPTNWVTTYYRDNGYPTTEREKAAWDANMALFDRKMAEEMLKNIKITKKK